jgi:AraC-like DNA-binding protein
MVDRIGGQTMERAIITRTGVATTARVIQRGEVLSHQVTMVHPVLIQVISGEKVLRRHGHDVTVLAGESVAVAGGQTFDILNRLGTNGWYEARWLMFDQVNVAAWFAENPQLPTITELLPLHRPEPEFSRLVDSTMEAIEDPDALPQPVAVARVREVLAWIGVHGGRFPPMAKVSVSDRVRQLLSAEPGQPWTAKDLCARLAMSEATLRRHLAKEGQAFSSLLAEVRLTQAFNLILATDRSIEAIAQSVGYESASRFAARFRELFGHHPSILRGHQRTDDRLSTKVDRNSPTRQILQM